MEYSFNNAQILAIGDLVLDRYIYGSTERTSPEAPVPIVDIQRIEERPGCVGNVAANIVALGAQCTLLSMLGSDAEAKILRQALEQRGIDVCASEVAQQTIIQSRIISQQQQLLRMDQQVSYDALNKQPLMGQYEAALTSPQVVLISDSQKGMLPDPVALIATAGIQKVPVFVDLRHDGLMHYPGVTGMVVGVRDFLRAMADTASQESLTDVGELFMEQTGLEVLLLTRGAQGLMLFTKDKPPVTIPAANKDVYDATGARDTVAAAFTTAVAAGYDYDRAARIANKAAGIAVTKTGTATVSLQELQSAFDSELASHQITTGILPLEELKKAVQAAQRADETIVFTNGCFDLLHAGHVAYLQEAKKLGDRLIVGINEDASIQRIKGDSRPIQDFSTRSQLLYALSAVDWVIGFSEDTPCNLLRALQPDILVKGGDYDISGVVGREIVEVYGGRVEVIKHGYADCTTSSTLSKAEKLFDGEEH